MDINEATRISDFVRDKLIEAVNAGKEVDIDFERGMKDITKETETITRTAPSGEFNLKIHIPADL